MPTPSIRVLRAYLSGAVVRGTFGLRAAGLGAARPTLLGMVDDSPLLLALELGGIFVFAISGGLVAVRKHLDIFGVVVLAGATGLGGGFLRDVLIGATPPTALDDWRYLLVPVGAGLTTFAFHPTLGRLEPFVNIFDAAGLGLFCVAGTAKAYDYGLNLTASVALGLATAVGGGVLRDVLANEVPSLLRWDRDLYAVPAIVGASLTVLCIHYDALTPVTGTLAAVTAFVLRLLAMRFHWRAPRAWNRRSTVREE